jgi:hypothetical protein
MRPYVICHMVASLDGRTLPSRWAPGEVNLHGAYERLHEKLDGHAWLVGRVTGQEFAKCQAYPAGPTESLPREARFARKDAGAYAVVLDAWQDRLGSRRHRRRSYRGGPDRDRLRCPSGGTTPLILAPAVDGRKGAPSLFDGGAADPAATLTFRSATRQEG